MFGHIAKDITGMVPFMKSTTLFHRCLELQVQRPGFFPKWEKKDLLWVS